MTLKDLNEMVTSATLDGALNWNETPGDVKDSTTHQPSKLPIDTSILTKKKKKIKIQRIRTERIGSFLGANI